MGFLEVLFWIAFMSIAIPFLIQLISFLFVGIVAIYEETNAMGSSSRTTDNMTTIERHVKSMEQDLKKVEALGPDYKSQADKIKENIETYKRRNSNVH